VQNKNKLSSYLYSINKILYYTDVFFKFYLNDILFVRHIHYVIKTWQYILLEIVCSTYYSLKITVILLFVLGTLKVENRDVFSINSGLVT